MTRAHLAIVPEQPERVDIYANWRAEIRRRDWSAVMVRGDRAPPLFMADAPKRIWRR